MPTIESFVHVGAGLDDLGHAVDHRPQKQAAEHGAGNRADTALQAAPADDGRGDRVELVAAPSVWGSATLWSPMYRIPAIEARIALRQ